VKFQQILWVIVKIGIIVLMTIMQMISNSQRTANAGPYWLILVPMLLIIILVPKHIKQIALNRPYLPPPRWTANPFRPFDDPFSFYHLAGWACFISGALGLVWGAWHHLRLDVSALGAGCGLALLLTVRFISGSIQKNDQKVALGRDGSSDSPR